MKAPCISLTAGKFGCTKVAFECFILAVARTKKQAKQQAAFRMLNRLKTSLADVLTVTASDKGDNVSEKVCTVIISTHYVMHIWKICSTAGNLRNCLFC